MAGLSEFAHQLPDWAARDDLECLASYAWQCIEKFGTGGGNFRTLYAAFGEEPSWVPVTILYQSDVKGKIEPCG